LPSGATGQWTIISSTATLSNTSSASACTVTGLNDGSNTFKWTVYKGNCSAEDIATITKSMPSPTASAAKTEVCVDTASLIGSNPAPGTGIWTVTGGQGSFANNSSSNTQVTGLGAGNNQFTWTVYVGTCSASATVSITDNTVVANAHDTTTCVDGSTLRADPISWGTGEWSNISTPAAVISATGSVSTTVSGLTDGANTFRWVVVAGNCTADDVATITKSMPVATATSESEVCSDLVNLTANDPAPGTGSWTLSGGTGTIAAPLNPITTATGLSTSITNQFMWTVYVGSCTAIATTSVVNNTVTANGYDDVTCSSTATLTSAALTNGTGVWTNISNLTAVIANSTATSTTVSGLADGANTFRWTASDGNCSAEDVVTITKTIAIATATSETEVCDGVANLDGNNPTPGTGLWTRVGAGAGTITSSSSNITTVTGLGTSGSEQYAWTVYVGSCTATAVTTVTNNSVKSLVKTMTNPIACNTNTVTLNAGTNPSLIGATGTWTIVSSTGTISNETSWNTASVAGLNEGINTFRWNVLKGNCSSDTISTVVRVIATANTSLTETCDGTLTLTGNNVVPYGGTGIWTQTSGSGAVFNTNTSYISNVTGILTTNNTFRWRVTYNTCTVNATVNVTNNMVTAIANNATTCTDIAPLVAVPATAPATGEWSVLSSNGTISNINSASTSVSGLDIGENTFVWTITKGNCSATATATITRSEITATAAVSKNEICNETIDVYGNDVNLITGATGRWDITSGSGTFANSTANNTQALNLGYGTNILRWTVTTGACSSEATVTVVNNQPMPANAGTDQHTCHQYTTLNAVNPTNGTGEWSTSGSAIVTNSSVRNPLVTGLNVDANIFTWTVLLGNCSTTDDVIIYNDSVSVSNAGLEDTVCDATATLGGNIPVYGTGSWTLQYNAGSIANSTQFNTSVSNLGLGENIFRWTIQKGNCSQWDDVSIYNIPVIADAGLDSSVCADTATMQGNNPLTQSYGIFIATGIWTKEPATATATIDDETFFNTRVRDLPLDISTFRWTVSNGKCSDYDDIIITNNTPNPSYAGRDTTLCDTTYQLQGNNPLIPQPRGTGVWTLIAGGGDIVAPSTYNSTVYNLAYYMQMSNVLPNWWTLYNTINRFAWTITYNGCTSTDTVNIINLLPYPANAGLDDTVCDDDVNLDALCEGSGAMEHWWENRPDPNVNTPNIIDPGRFNSHVDSLRTGWNTFRWNKRNTLNNVTCWIWDEVMIYSLGIETTNSAGSDDGVCDTTYQLNGTNPQNVFNNGTDSVDGLWTIIHGDGTIQQPTKWDSRVINLGYGTNIFRWTVTNYTQNCVQTDDVYILNGMPSDADAGPDTSVCTDYALLSANRITRGTGIWTVVGGEATLVNPTCYVWSCNVFAHGMGPGNNTFLWTTSNTVAFPDTNHVPKTLTCQLSDEVTIINNSVKADAGVDVDVCSDTTLLNANDPGDGIGGYWRTLGGGGQIQTSTAYNTLVRNLTRASLNTFVWTYVKGQCSSTDTMQVFDNLPYPHPAAGGDQKICDDSTTITGSSFVRGTGHWKLINGIASIDCSTCVSTAVQGIPAQNSASFAWVAKRPRTLYANQYCELSDTVVVFNNSITAVAGPDQFPVCGTETTNSSTSLNATTPTSPATGIWSVVVGPASLSNPTLVNTVVTGMNNGDKVFRWTVTLDNCTATDEVTIKSRIPTTAIVANDSIETCADTAGLQANTPINGTGYWNALYAGSDLIVSSNQSTTSVRDLSKNKTKFSWTINNDGCLSIDTMTIMNHTVTADADISASNIVNICVPTYVLSANDPGLYDGDAPSIGTGAWTKNLASITFLNSTVYNTTVSGLSSTLTNTLTWTVRKGGCSIYSQLEIHNNEFTISAGPDQIVCENQVTMDGEQPGSGTGIWDAPSGGIIQNSTAYNTVVTNLPPNDLTFTWTIYRNNCSAIDTVIITNHTVSSNAGDDEEVCADTTSLKAGVPTSPSTGAWATIIGMGAVTTSSAFDSKVSGMSTGRNMFRWRVSWGICTADDFVDITNNTTSPASIETDKTVCVDTTSLSANTTPTIGTGEWTLESGTGNIRTSTDVNTSAINLGTGPNTFRWTIRNGSCSVIDEVIVTNHTVASDAGLAQDVCEDSTRLNATPPSTFYPHLGTGTWTTISGFGTVADATSETSLVRGLTPGLNKFRWTVQYGLCTAIDEVIVMNNQVFATASDQNTCWDTARLDGNNPSGATGTWTRDAGNSAAFDNSTVYNTVVRDLGPGANTFYWTIYKTGCSAVKQISVTNNYYTVDAGLNKAICETTDTMAAEDPTPGTGIWSRQTGSGAMTTIENTKYNAVVTNLSSGNNVWRWTIHRHGCSFSSDVIISNDLPTVSNIPQPDREECANFTTLQANLPVYGTGKWELLSGSCTSINSSNYYITDVTGLGSGDNIFTWTITNNACSSVDQIKITNNEITADAGSDKDVCEDSSTLGAILPTSGTGKWTIVSSSGSIENTTLYNSKVTGLNANINRFSWTVTKGGCTATSNVDIVNKAVAAIATSQDVCQNSALLDGNEPPSGGSGFWTDVSGGATFADSTLYNTTVNNLNPGVSTFIWTVQKDLCSATKTITITNNAFIIDAGVTQSVCADTFRMNAEAPGTGGTGNWAILSGSTTLEASTSENTLVSNLVHGNNIYRWTVYRNNCSAVDSLTITNNLPTTADIVYPVNKEVCTNEVTLQSNNPIYGTGQWSLVSGAGSFSTTSGLITNVTGLTRKNNHFKWTIRNVNCISEDTITILNNTVVADAGSDQTVCIDTTTIIASDPATIYPFFGTGSWANVGAGSASISTSTSRRTHISLLSPGINKFRWTVKEGNCSIYDDVDVNNNQVFASASNQTTCGETVTLDGNAPSGGATGIWTKLGGIGNVETSDSYSSKVINLTQGTGTFRWTVTSSDGSCTASKEITVTCNTYSVNAGIDQHNCADTAMMAGDDPTTGTGIWTRISGSATISQSTDFDTKIIDLSKGENIFVWTIYKNNCSFSDTTSIFNDLPTTSQILSPLNIEVCDTFVSLQGNNPTFGTGQWTKEVGTGNFLPNNTSTVATFDNLDVKNNKFFWTISNGNCSSVAEITIVNNKVKSDAGDSITVCDSFANLAAIQPPTVPPYIGVGKWEAIGGAGTVVVHSSLAYNTTVSNLAIGTNKFRWTVTEGNCSAVDEVDVVSNRVIASAANQDICTDTAILNGNPPTGGATGIWEKVGASAVTIVKSTLYNTVVRNIPIGSVTLKWTIYKNNCSASKDIVLTNNLFTTNAGSNQIVCYDTTYMRADDPSLIPATGFWTKISGTSVVVSSESTLPSAHITNLSQGSNIFQWTVTKGSCSLTKQVTITNDSPTASNITTSNQEVCTNSASLLGNEPTEGTGVWTVISGYGRILTSDNYSTTVDSLVPGESKFRWTIVKNSCSSEDDVIITNNTVTSNAGDNKAVCYNSTSLLAVPPTFGTGEWSTVSGTGTVVTPTLNNSSVIGLSSGGNTFRWTVLKGGCSIADDMVVTNDSVNATATNQQVCETFTTLDGNDPSGFGATGEWTKMGTTTASITNSTKNNTTVTGLNSGTNTFVWTVRRNSCTAEKVIVVTNNEFSVSAGTSEEVCDTLYTLSGDDPTPGTGRWTILNGGNISDLTQYNSVADLNLGDNIYQWTVYKNNCSGSGLVTITNHYVKPVATGSSVCDSTATLNGNNPPIGGTGYWTNTGGTSAEITSYDANLTPVTNLIKGPNVFTWTLVHGICSETSNAVVVSNNSFTVSAGNDDEACENHSYTFAADAPGVGGTGYWEIVSSSTGTIDPTSSTSNIATVTNLNAGVNIFRWTVVRDGCSASGDVRITNNTVEATATSQPVCSSTETLDGNALSGGATGIWTRTSGSSNITNSTQNNTTVTNLELGPNTFRWVVRKGSCADSVDIVVTNYSFNVNAGNDDTTCVDNSYTFAADDTTGGATGLWTVVSSTGTLNNSSIATATVTGLNPGSNIFRWTITRNNCSFDDEVIITNNTVTATASNRTVCENSVTLDGNNPLFGATGAWTKSGGGATFENSTQNNSIVNNLDEGANNLSWTVKKGMCSAVANVVINYAGFVLSAGNDAETCDTNSYTFAASDPSPNGTGYWSTVSSSGTINNSTLFNTYVTGMNSGTNIFRWTTFKGACSYADEVTIINNTVVATASDQSVCENTATLNGNAQTSPAYGTWTNIGGTAAAITSSNVGNTTVTGLATTPNVFRWTVVKGNCSASKDITVSNNSFTLTDIDENICSSTYTFLTDEPGSGGTGVWNKISSSGNIDNSTYNRATVTNLNLGANIFTWTIYRNSCSAFSTVTITNSSVTASASNQVTCENIDTLDGNIPPTGATGKWEKLDAVGSTVIASTDKYNSTVSDLQGGLNSFRWTVIGLYCTASTEITIMNNHFTVTTDTITPICSDSDTLRGEAAGTGNSGIWTIVDGNPAVIISTNESTTAVTGLKQGSNKFRWTVTRGLCSAYDEVTVINAMPSTAQIIQPSGTAKGGL